MRPPCTGGGIKFNESPLWGGLFVFAPRDEQNLLPRKIYPPNFSNPIDKIYGVQYNAFVSGTHRST